MLYLGIRRMPEAYCTSRSIGGNKIKGMAAEHDGNPGAH